MDFWRVMFLCFLVQFNTSCLLLGQALPEAKVVVTVLDGDTLKPVENARVRIGFRPDMPISRWYKRGATNSEGVFAARSKTINSVPIRVEKEKYYRSGSGAKLKSVNKLLNRWEPWPSKVTIKLRKKKNPVPMYVRKVEGKIPVVGKPVGFDLEKGDWVKPFGKGEVADFVFTVKRDYKAYLDFSLSYTLVFSNKFDGIQEYHMDATYEQSYFKWPYEAPIDGYKKKLSRYKSIHPNNDNSDIKWKIDTNFKDKIKYIYRVRTKTDGAGKIISANYGKIIGEIIVDRELSFGFTYYFNPDPKSRSLEFDPDRNLFKDVDRRFAP